MLFVYMYKGNVEIETSNYHRTLFGKIYEKLVQIYI